MVISYFLLNDESLESSKYTEVSESSKYSKFLYVLFALLRWFSLFFDADFEVYTIIWCYLFTSSSFLGSLNHFCQYWALLKATKPIFKGHHFCHLKTDEWCTYCISSAFWWSKTLWSWRDLTVYLTFHWCILKWLFKHQTFNAGNSTIVTR